MTSYYLRNNASFFQLSDLIVAKCSKNGTACVGLVLYGSSVVEQRPRDIDLLVVVDKDLTPSLARRVRGKLAVAVSREVQFELDLDIRLRSLRGFSALSPLHFGILEGYVILHEKSGLIGRILARGEQIRARWGTRKLKLGKNDWVLLPKGTTAEFEPIIYGEKLD